MRGGREMGFRTMMMRRQFEWILGGAPEESDPARIGIAASQRVKNMLSTAPAAILILGVHLRRRTVIAELGRGQSRDRVMIVQLSEKSYFSVMA